MPAHESNIDRWYQERARNFLNVRTPPSAVTLEYVNNPPMYFVDWSMCEWGTKGNRMIKGIAEYKKRKLRSDAPFLHSEGMMIPARKFHSARMMCSFHDITFHYITELDDGLFLYEEEDFKSKGLSLPSFKQVSRRGDPNDQSLVVMLDWDHFHKIADVQEMEAYAPYEKRKAKNEQDGSEIRRAS